MILAEWWRRIWYLVNRRRFERELEEEMAAHREMMGEPQRFGNALRLREESRDVWGWNWLDDAWQDVRHGARTLRHAPSFALTAVLILSAGIGLNLAFFQLLNVTALRPPPVKSPDTLVRFYRVAPTFMSSGVPYPATQFIRRHNGVLSAVLPQHRSDVVWGDDATDRLRASYVSANWFAELGYGAMLGRVFVEALDETPDAAPVIVVSHDFWRTRLRRDPEVVGRTVRVNDRAANIIGVAPERFPGLRLDDPQLWLLIHQIDYFNPGTAFKDEWGAHNTELYARLRPGISPAAAKEGLRATVRELARVRPAEFRHDESLEPYSGRDGFRGPRDRRELSITLLIGSLTLLVLMVACANLSNLILSHAIGRLREFSVRAALGATRWRVLRQQLVESLLLATLGALGGLLLGHWCVRIFAVQTSLPKYLDFAPDWRMVTAACVIAFLAVLAFGLVPAWMVSRRDLIAVMKDGGQQASGRLARAPFRLLLIASQVAGCCVLLIVAGLMVRGLQRLLTADPGFEFEQVAVLDASLPRYGIRGEAARVYWAEVKRAVSPRPDVKRLALASQAPLGDSFSESLYWDAPRLKVTSMSVEPSFFSLMRIPLLTGRNFEPADSARAVVIVSRRLAVEMYGTLDVLGKGFPKSKPDRTIIGIAGDAQLNEVTATNVAEQYSPVDPDGYGHLLLLARARGNPERLLTPMRAAARVADARVLAKTWLPKTNFEEKLRARRLASFIAGLTGLLALSLACFGIFGLVAYGVALRTKEIGIRRALGADGRAVIRLLLRQLAFPVGMGMLLGTVAGLAVGWLLEREPFYLPSANAATPAAALVLFALTAAVAAVVPASRALGTDPLQALRHE